MSDFATSLAAARDKGPKGAQKSSVIPELANQGRLPGWSAFMPDERETVDAWRGQQRIETVEEMLNDSQVTALRQAVRLPVHRYVIELDPMDADRVAVDKLAADLDVPVKDGREEMRPGRRAERFNGRQHLDRALDALDYGYAVFEHTGRYDEDGWWRLAGLPPVPQWTIPDVDSWEVDRHGRLLAIKQWGAALQPVRLDVDHVTVFTWQGRAGDFRGRPMLRSLYRNYLMRDRTMRVMGMSAERTGMGIPVGKAPTSGVAGAREQMSALLGGLAAGHDTHLVLDTEDDIRKAVMLMGVTGGTPDLVAMLRYHDEAMARAMLAMLLQLGQTNTGSRALGGTFDDLLADFHDTVVDWYCDGMQQQTVERWWTRNPVADQDAVPRLVWSRREDSEGEEPAAEEPVIEGEAVEEDEPQQLLVAASGRQPRRQVASSALAKGVPAGEGIASEPGSGASRANGSAPDRGVLTHAPSPAARATRAAFATVTGRDLRRDPTDVELAAGTDFATIEAQYVATRESVAAALIAVRDELTSTAVEQVAVMETVDPLTLGEALAPILERHAEEMDSAPLVALLVAFAAAGVNQVVGEAARQGVTLAASIDYADRAEADARDLMRRMAGQVAESSASAARTGVPAGSQGWPAAQMISDHLGSLTSAAASQAAAGATSRAQNAGRAAAIAEGPVRSLAASEVLDQSVCENCLLVDGTQYDSLDAALADYPGGGYSACAGGERCRGTLIAIFEVEPEAF